MNLRHEPLNKNEVCGKFINILGTESDMTMLLKLAKI